MYLEEFLGRLFFLSPPKARRGCVTSRGPRVQSPSASLLERKRARWFGCALSGVSRAIKNASSGPLKEAQLRGGRRGLSFFPTVCVKARVSARSSRSSHRAFPFFERPKSRARTWSPSHSWPPWRQRGRAPRHLFLPPPTLSLPLCHSPLFLLSLSLCLSLPPVLFSQAFLSAVLLVGGASLTVPRCEAVRGPRAIVTPWSRGTPKLCSHPLCHFATLALWHFATLPLWHFGTLPLYHFATLPLCHFATCHFATLPLCHFATLLLCPRFLFLAASEPRPCSAPARPLLPEGAVRKVGTERGSATAAVVNFPLVTDFP